MFASSSGQLGKRLNAWVSSTVLYLTSIIYAAAALINFFGCLWYWVARREGLTNSWLTDVGELLLLLLQLVILLPAIAMRRVMHAAAANSVFIARYRHAQRCACYCCKVCFHCYALLPCAEVCIPDPRERHIFD